MSSRFPCVTARVERFSLDLPQADKNIGNVFWNWAVGVCGMWLNHGCIQSVTAGLLKGNFFKVGTSNEESYLRRSRKLLVVIFLVLRRVKAEEIGY